MTLSFYMNDGRIRVYVTFTRPHLASTRIERTIIQDAGFHGLTSLEHEISTAVALGFSNEEIGRQRNTSRRTIDHHVSNILARLGFNNRAQLSVFIAATNSWMIPFPEKSILEAKVAELNVLGLSPLRSDVIARNSTESCTPTLHVGSLLPSDPEKQQESLAMSRGEDLAVSGAPVDKALSSHFPVRITRLFASADDIDLAVEALLSARIQALTIGNFDIPSAKRILENKKLRGIPILHSMVNKHVNVFTGPNPTHDHIFQMCADESVYLRAYAAYARKFVPEAERLAVIIRGSDSVEVIETIKSSLGDPSAVDIKVIRIDECGENLAEIALELHHFKPDVVYIGVYVEPVLVELLSYIQTLRLATQLFCVWVPGIPGFTQRNPELAEGLVWSTLVGDSNNYFGSQFRSAFERMFRSSPGIGSAAVHYDMVGLLKRAWIDAGLEGSPSAIISSLDSVQFTGVTGTFHFDNGRRRALCYPFDTDDPTIGQPCLTFRIRRGKSIPISLSGSEPDE